MFNFGVYQSCPGDWNTVISPVRGCAGTCSQSSSAFSNGTNSIYNKVCGRIIGDLGTSQSNPDAFFRYNTRRQATIESRTHIWSLAAGHSAAFSYRNHGYTVPL